MHNHLLTASHMLTGDVIHWFDYKILNGERLSQWAEQLLLDGHDTREIRMAAASPDAHWEDVNRWFVSICRQLQISDDIASDLKHTEERVVIDEYRAGQRKAAYLLWHLKDLRKRIGFPEIVVSRIMPDGPDGTNPSGYYGVDSGLTGERLEEEIRPYLERAGIYAV